MAAVISVLVRYVNEREQSFWIQIINVDYLGSLQPVNVLQGLEIVGAFYL